MLPGIHTRIMVASESRAKCWAQGPSKLEPRKVSTEAHTSFCQASTQNHYCLHARAVPSMHNVPPDSAVLSLEVHPVMKLATQDSNSSGAGAGYEEVLKNGADAIGKGLNRGSGTKRVCSLLNLGFRLYGHIHSTPYEGQAGSLASMTWQTCMSVFVPSLTFSPARFQISPLYDRACKGHQLQ